MPVLITELQSNTVKLTLSKKTYDQSLFFWAAKTLGINKRNRAMCGREVLSDLENLIFSMETTRNANDAGENLKIS